MSDLLLVLLASLIYLRKAVTLLQFNAAMENAQIIDDLYTDIPIKSYDL